MANWPRICLVVIAAFMLSIWAHSSAIAGPFEDGEIAYYTGDYPTALKLLQPLADQGHAAAQLDIANMYENGRGVKQDNAEAVKWTLKAAERGNADAQLRLGALYAKGLDGLKQDWVEAKKWFLKAAEQGNSLAQLNMGQMYKNGWGVNQDNVQAYMWYSISVAAGNKDAASKTGSIAATMTPEQIAQAKRLAAAWKPTLAAAARP
jgi:TPR repeat protein